MSGKILISFFIFMLSVQSQAGYIYDLACESSQEIIAKGLRAGNGKMASIKKIKPPAIFYDIESESFVSTREEKNSYIELKHFLNGKLLLPRCKGSKVILKNKFIVD